VVLNSIPRMVEIRVGQREIASAEDGKKGLRFALLDGDREIRDRLGGSVDCD
jgi:hypothetical protein